MSTIVLHGALKREFGGPFSFEVASPAEAFRALEANFPGRFFAAVRDGVYRIVRGDRKKGLALGPDQLTFGLGSADLHIIPLARGSAGSQRSKGGVKAVIGVAMMAVAIVATEGAASALLAGSFKEFGTLMGAGGLLSWGTVASYGLSMTLAGVSAMLSPQPKAQDLQPVDQRQSYLFNGPVNLTEQGGAVPLIYGRCRVGSTTISAGIDVEQVPYVLTDPSAAITVSQPQPLPPPGGVTKNGLVIAAAAGASLTGYRLSAITGGTLAKRNGEALGDGATITLAEGTEGLVFDLDGDPEIFNPGAGDPGGDTLGHRGSFLVTGLRADGSSFGSAAVEVLAAGGTIINDH